MNSTSNENFKPSCCVKEAQQEVFRKYNEILQQDDYSASQYRNANKPTKLGDINQDGKIDSQEVEIIQTLIDAGITSVADAQAYFDEHHLDYNAKAADINGDGIIDQDDLDASVATRTVTFTIVVPEGAEIPEFTIDNNATEQETYPIWSISENTGTIEFASDKDLKKNHTFKAGDFELQTLLSPEEDNTIDLSDYYPSITLIVDITDSYDTSYLNDIGIIEIEKLD